MFTPFTFSSILTLSLLKELITRTKISLVFVLSSWFTSFFLYIHQLFITVSLYKYFIFHDSFSFKHNKCFSLLFYSNIHLYISRCYSFFKYVRIYLILTVLYKKLHVLLKISTKVFPNKDHVLFTPSLRTSCTQSKFFIDHLYSLD